MPQQPVELGRRHLREHALLELEPQPRHRQEQRRLRALQVLQEGVERLREEQVQASVDQRRGFGPGALEAVGKRQVGQHPVLGADALLHHGGGAFAGAGEGAERDHHALGRAGRTRRVDQHREVVPGACRAARQRRGARDDRVPGVEVVLRRERKGDAGHPRRHAALLVLPGVELADEQQARLAVRQHVVDRLGGLGRKDGDRGVAGHPDRDLGHDEVGAVLRQDRDARAGRVAAALQVRRHAARLVDHLAPRVVDHLVVADRLRHVDAVAQVLLVIEDVIQHQLVRCHVSSIGMWSVAAGFRLQRGAGAGTLYRRCAPALASGQERGEGARRGLPPRRVAAAGVPGMASIASESRSYLRSNKSIYISYVN